jgi:alanine racemase
MRPIQATISLSALAHNLAVAKSKVPQSKVMAVVKANGYGHGLLNAAKGLKLADGFAILGLDEALTLRSAGYKQTILMLEGFFSADELSAISEHAISIVVHSHKQVEMLESANLTAPISIHLKMNTGMNRLGFKPQDFEAVLARLKTCQNVADITLMEHFATADESLGIAKPLAVFKQAAQAHQYPQSLANSAALLRFPEAHADWVRAGIMLYGTSPIAEDSAAKFNLKPVMQFTSEIISVQMLDVGESLGYGHRFTATQKMRIGVVGLNGRMSKAVIEAVSNQPDCIISGVLVRKKSEHHLPLYENIQELLNGIKDFVEQPRTPQEEELKEAIYNSTDEPNPVELFDVTEKSSEIKTLDEFMQEISLLTDVDKESEDDKNADKISMMTIHASKGLEFPYVHIVGLEENLFPSQMALNSRSELEEERRLFYVAITRAEKKATISFATTRYRFGNVIYCEPSRFIDELDENCIDYPQENSSTKFSDNAFGEYRKKPFNDPMKSIDFRTKPNEKSVQEPHQINFSAPKKLIPLAKRMALNNSLTDNSANANLRVGSIVEHEKFGIGEVSKIEGTYPESKALIIFRDAGEKNLLLKYAKLKTVI